MLGCGRGERAEALLQADEYLDESGAVSGQRPEGVDEEVVHVRARHPHSVVFEGSDLTVVNSERAGEHALQRCRHLDGGARIVRAGRERAASEDRKSVV